MNKSYLIKTAFGVAVFLTGCAGQYQQTERQLAQPVNCATAEGDIRVLQSEKTHAAQQLAMGVTSIVPVGLVVGLVGGTEKTKLQVATGEYNKMIDQKIAQIKTTCGLA